MILSCCLRLLSEFRDIGALVEAPESSPAYAQKFFDELIVKKTWTRFGVFCDGEGLTLDTRFTLNDEKLPPLKRLLELVISNIPESKPSDISFWHGDFFFGNLFFDFNARRIIMVDPRGLTFDDSVSQYGDFRYDIGKLAHSALGGYDHILANRYFFSRKNRTELEFRIPDLEGRQHRILAGSFCELVHSTFGLEQPTLYALASLMFFSMLPLHRESPQRQNALLAAALNMAMKLSA
jgi:hypothetical protein